MTQDPSKPKTHPMDRVQKTLAILMILLMSISMFILVVSVTVLYFRDESRKDEVVLRQDAGVVIQSSQDVGLFSRGWMETDKAFMALIDPMSLFKGESLVLETRGNQARYLCVNSHHCVKLSTPY